MNERQAAEAVATWAGEVLGIVEASRYPFPVATKLGGLPDLVAYALRKRIVPEDPENFPFRQLEQVWLRIFDIELSVMVEPAEADDGELLDTAALRAPHDVLRGFGEILEGSALKDPTLGTRVQMTSPRMIFDYSQPFAEYEDGTRGPEMSVTLAVAEAIDVE